MAEDEQADWIRIVRCAHADGQRFRCLGTQRDRTSSGERFRPLPVSEPTRSEQRAWHGEFGQVKCSYGGLVGFTACRLLEFVFVWRTTSFHAVKATMMLKQTVVRARLGVLRKLWQIYAETVLPLEQKPAPDCEKPLQTLPESAWPGETQGHFTSTFVPHPSRWKSSKRALRCGAGKKALFHSLRAVARSWRCCFLASTAPAKHPWHRPCHLCKPLGCRRLAKL